MTLIFAHRGASAHCPENTMAAFMKAAQLGADGIELDVQLSLDKIPVVIHDSTLHRTTTGYGNVNKKTVLELKELDAGIWFSDEYANETIPTLNEVLRWLQHTHLLLNIELKSRGIASDLEKVVIDLIKKYQLEKRIIISSFWKSSLEKVKELHPEIEICYLVEKPTEATLELVRKLNFAGIHPNYKHITKNFVNKTKDAKLQIRPFTANQKKAIEKLLHWKVDALFTDYPDKAIALRNRKHTKI